MHSINNPFILIPIILTLTLLTIAIRRWSRYKGWKTILLYSLILGLGIYLLIMPNIQINSGIVALVALSMALATIWQFDKGSI